MSRTFTIPIQYGPNGCQVNIGGNQTCRETQTLEIIKEFNRVYESKLHELNNIGCGDNLLAKVHLQQDWIRDLTQQNELLVRAVEELEKEAAERVSMLEERLQNGAQVMQKYKDNFSVYLNETFQRIDYLQKDVGNLVEFIARIRDNRLWSIEGLRFYTINPPSLLKTCNCCCDCPTTLEQDVVVQDTQPPPLRDQETANEDVQKLDTKLKEMQKQLNHSPKETELEELNFKLHLKDEELGSLKRRCCDVEADSTELRTKFKELEKENTTLKDTIFQANRELEKFYEQANDCVKERDEYKRKFKEGTDALAAAQARFASDNKALEKKVAGQEETIKKMIREQEQLKDQLTNCKRQSESLSQAQNETIQALQEAIHEKDKASEMVRVLPLTSEESWTSTATTTSKSSRAKTPQSGNEKEASVSVVGLTEQETPSCLSNQSKGLKKGPDCVQKESVLKDVCPAFDGFEELKKVQRERDYEREIHKQEVDNLKKTIEELEKGGVDSRKLLEAECEQFKQEIYQQRITITNLQEALKSCKIQLDDLQQRSSNDVSWATKWLGLSSSISKTPANNNMPVHDV